MRKTPPSEFHSTVILFAKDFTLTFLGPCQRWRLVDFAQMFCMIFAVTCWEPPKVYLLRIQVNRRRPNKGSQFPCPFWSKLPKRIPTDSLAKTWREMQVCRTFVWTSSAKLLKPKTQCNLLECCFGESYNDSKIFLNSQDLRRSRGQWKQIGWRLGRRLRNACAWIKIRSRTFTPLQNRNAYLQAPWFLRQKVGPCSVTIISFIKRTYMCSFIPQNADEILWCGIGRASLFCACLQFENIPFSSVFGHKLLVHGVFEWTFLTGESGVACEQRAFVSQGAFFLSASAQNIISSPLQENVGKGGTASVLMNLLRSGHDDKYGYNVAKNLTVQQVCNKGVANDLRKQQVASKIEGLYIDVSLQTAEGVKQTVPVIRMPVQQPIQVQIYSSWDSHVSNTPPLKWRPKLDCFFLAARIESKTCERMHFVNRFNHRKWRCSSPLWAPQHRVLASNRIRWFPCFVRPPCNNCSWSRLTWKPREKATFRFSSYFLKGPFCRNSQLTTDIVIHQWES